METEFARIAEIISNHPGEKITTLMHYINAETLKSSYYELSSNKACGVDGVTKDAYGANLDENIDKLITRMKTNAYKPQPVKRVLIEKEGSKEMRPLGILTFEDKIVQNVIKKILEVIYEPMFIGISFGFRPGANRHAALGLLNKIIETKKVNYVVDADIKGFFNSMDHNWIIEFLKYRISDKNLLRLIMRFLKSGVIHEGKRLEVDVGSQQGGCISPIIGNIYLHFVLDLWFDKVIKKKCRGEAYLVRFADDLACCFLFRDDAEMFYAELIERLAKFKLEIAGEKSRIIRFGRFAEKDLARKVRSRRHLIFWDLHTL